MRGRGLDPTVVPVNSSLPWACACSSMVTATVSGGPTPEGPCVALASPSSGKGARCDRLLASSTTTSVLCVGAAMSGVARLPRTRARLTTAASRSGCAPRRLSATFKRTGDARLGPVPRHARDYHPRGTHGKRRVYNAPQTSGRETAEVGCFARVTPRRVAGVDEHPTQVPPQGPANSSFVAQNSCPRSKSLSKPVKFRVVVPQISLSQISSKTRVRHHDLVLPGKLVERPVPITEQERRVSGARLDAGHPREFATPRLSHSDDATRAHLAGSLRPVPCRANPRQRNHMWVKLLVPGSTEMHMRQPRVCDTSATS